jgi:hypothetical protein
MLLGPVDLTVTVTIFGDLLLLIYGLFTVFGMTLLLLLHFRPCSIFVILITVTDFV